MKNFFKKIKSNSSFIVPWLILGLAVIIFGSGLTYAYFDFVLNSQEESSLKVTGTDFSVSLYGDTISVSDLTPIYDEYYDEQALEYLFEVENDSRRVTACYSIYFDINTISESLISSDFKWKLVNLDTLEETDGNFAGASNPEVIIKADNDIIAHTTDHYKLYIWLSYSDSNQSDTLATTFSSNLKLNANSGTCDSLRVNTKLDHVRYIKSCVNGSTLSANNHWVELKAIYNGTNVAYGKTATGTVAENATYPYSRITDGDTATANYAQAGASGLQCITVDLTQPYNLDEIILWRYYGDSRTYYSNTTYVSSDNSTWTPVLVGSTAESSQGKKVTAFDSNTTVTPIYRVSNLVTNGSFENGTTGWTVYSPISPVENASKYGNYLLFNYHAGQYQNAGQQINAIANNIYYASVWMYTYAVGTGKCYNDMNIYYGGTDHWQGFGGTQNNIRVWEKKSQLYTIPSVTSPIIIPAILPYSATDSLGDCYADGVFLIDLTATFGAGKEPSKAWCDANLDYFDGSQNMNLTP